MEGARCCRQLCQRRGQMGQVGHVRSVDQEWVPAFVGGVLLLDLVKPSGVSIPHLDLGLGTVLNASWDKLQLFSKLYALV